MQFFSVLLTFLTSAGVSYSVVKYTYEDHCCCVIARNTAYAAGSIHVHCSPLSCCRLHQVINDYTVSQKNQAAVLFLCNFAKLLTNFQNYFTNWLSNKFPAKWYTSNVSLVKHPHHENRMRWLTNGDYISRLVSMQRDTILNICCNIWCNMSSIKFSCSVAKHFKICFNNLLQ